MPARRVVGATLPVALGLAILPVLAACGSDGDGGAAATTTAPATSVPSTTTAGGAVVVAMGEYYYRPSDVTVRVGEPVLFRNDGTIEHTVADASPTGEIRSRLIRPRPLAHGDTQRVIFRSPGRVHYICTFHPTLMMGDITVVAR